MPQNEIAIKVENLTKSFHIPLEAHNGIKQKLINTLKGRKGYRVFTPLQDISFEIEKGDFFGIVGRNGSGKSTLLKTLAGIYSPDAGNVYVNGTLVPFIELGVGFNPELTGRENVFMNGALLGFSRKEMEAMYDEIVEFAEIGDFMEEKLKNYSSGMQVRLAFSIAIRAQSDILLLDEVLAVGDEAFQRKCYQYFAELKKQKKTVILVTHSMDSVQQFCSKAMLIDKGHGLTIGSPFEIAKIYRELNVESGIVGSATGDSHKQANSYFKLDTSFKKEDDYLRFNIILEPLKEVDDNLVFTFVINRDDGEMVYRFTSDEKIEHAVDFKVRNEFEIKLENIFPDGIFSVQVGVKRMDRSKNYAIFDDIIKFELSNGIGKEFWRPEEKYSVKELE
ncbi:ATP-binding cassette domain-containing protein [Candidatus Saccharibacteria bacterium]|nr:ATP-binding cassette domain-containing protein [Candidatus Saccharibacteria bacterium]